VVEIRDLAFGGGELLPPPRAAEPKGAKNKYFKRQNLVTYVQKIVKY
jgi:hypothetical protein